MSKIHILVENSSGDIMGTCPSSLLLEEVREVNSWIETHTVLEIDKPDQWGPYDKEQHMKYVGGVLSTNDNYQLKVDQDTKAEALLQLSELDALTLSELTSAQLAALKVWRNGWKAHQELDPHPTPLDFTW